MKNVAPLLASNSAWADEMLINDPNYFKRLAEQQKPRFLWIGCSDSRIPANQITGLAPGEVFVHRNIANIVQETDANALSVLQYAVDILKVTDVIVCGHYGCGGIEAAINNFREGNIGNWLSPIRAIIRHHKDELDQLEGIKKADRLCELNVESQAQHVARTSIIEKAWEREQKISIHSWIYRLNKGTLHQIRSLIRCSQDIETSNEIY